MRRKLFPILMAISLALLPATGRSHHGDGGDFAAGFAAGFLIPIFTMAIVEAATAPHYHYYYDPDPPAYAPRPFPPPEPPQASAPEPEAERAVPWTPPDPNVGEVTFAPRDDPALASAERLLREGEFFKASEAYRALARERPADRVIGLRFAEALLGVGNYRYAEYFLRRALQDGLPRGPLRSIGPRARLAERRSALEKRLALEPAAGSGRLLAAYAALASGDPAGAEAHLRALLLEKPGDLDALRLGDAIASRPGAEAGPAQGEGRSGAEAHPAGGSSRPAHGRVNPLAIQR